MQPGRQNAARQGRIGQPGRIEEEDEAVLPYRLTCTACGHMWISEVDYRRSGWNPECSKCGATGDAIANMGGVRNAKPRNYTHKDGR